VGTVILLSNKALITPTQLAHGYYLASFYHFVLGRFQNALYFINCAVKGNCLKEQKQSYDLLYQRILKSIWYQKIRLNFFKHRLVNPIAFFPTFPKALCPVVKVLSEELSFEHFYHLFASRGFSQW
jgi:hypothetical protein